MKHKKTAGLASLLAMLALSGSRPAALAYLGTGTESLRNVVTPGSVSITLQEESFVPDHSVGPGGSFEKDPSVTNTGKSPAWIFLEVAIPRREIATVVEGKKRAAALQELFTFSPSASWTRLYSGIRAEDGASLQVYGYRQVLASGRTTEPLFQKMTLIPYLEGEVGDGENLRVGIRALAIQSEGFQSLEEAYLKCFSL